MALFAHGPLRRILIGPTESAAIPLGGGPLSRTLALVAILLSASFLPHAAAQEEFTDPNPANAEWVESTLVIAQPDLRTLDVIGFIVLRKYSIEGTNYETADDIGNAYQQLLDADEFARQQGQEANRATNFVADMEKSTTDAIRQTLTDGFPGAEISVEPAILDITTLEGPEGNVYEPGVLLEIKARVVRTAEQAGIGDLSTDAIATGFALGAKISTSLSVTAAAGHHIIYVIEPPTVPAGVSFIQASPAPSVFIDGAAMVIEVDNSAGTEPMTVDATAIVADPLARIYTQAEINAGSAVTAIVDLKDIDIAIGKAIGGDMGNLVGEVLITADLSIIELPAEFQGTLPSSVDLKTLTSNGVRLLRKHGVITDAQVADLEKTFISQVEENLRNALQAPVKVSGGLVAGTIDADGITDVAGGAPLKLAAFATFLKPLSGGPAPEAAIALYTQEQGFDLPRVDGMPTSYKIILPKGLALTALNVNGGDKAQGTEGGRDWFSVSPTGDSAHAQVAMAVTPAFVFAKFLPVVIIAILVIILIIGTPIALVVRRRKGKSG